MTNSQKTYLIAVLGILIIAGLVWWSNQQENIQQAKRETIKIGVIGTLTGVGSHQGQEELRGVAMARDEINVAGGIQGKQIELVVEDSKTEPTTAISVMQKLISADQVKYIIGDSFTTTTVALVPIANQNNVILFPPNTTLNQLSQDDTMFRLMPTTEDLMIPLAEYAYTNLKVRRVGILRQDSPFGVEHAQNFRTAFEKFGGQVVGEEAFDLRATDVRTEINKIKAQQPDAVLNLHAGNRLLGLVMKQAKELGLEVVWLSHFGAESGVLIDEYGDVVNDLIYAYPYDASSSHPTVENFFKKYQARYGTLPDFNAPTSYDSLKLLAMAIEEAGDDSQRVKQYLLKVQDYTGASGTISFDQNGDVKKPVFIKQIQGGKFIILETND